MSTNALRQPANVDINYGVDYEMARDILNAAAGRAWREYLAAKQAKMTEADIGTFREAYLVAQQRFKHLKSTQTAEINAILSAGRS